MPSSWRLLTSILHPTDFSPESDVAFVHALKLAVAFSAELRLIHVTSEPAAADWSDFPGVRDTLIRWRLLPPGASRSDVAKLGIGVHKILEVGDQPRKALVEHIQERPPSLLVLATHQHHGLALWLSGAVAETVARGSEVPTLFVPAGRAGFVAAEDGSVRLQRVLIPVHQTPDPQLAIDAVVALAQALHLTGLEGHVLYVGDATERPELALPAAAGWVWHPLAQEGDVVERILRTAADLDADLLVMTTEGHVGLVDAILGSTTEQVLRSVTCPLLAVPRVLGTKARLLVEKGAEARRLVEEWARLAAGAASGPRPQANQTSGAPGDAPPPTH